jgi:hypothetical protein
VQRRNSINNCLFRILYLFLFYLLHCVSYSQILESLRSHPTPSVGQASVAAGVWVEGTCPARLDLAGGWTDTPPVCYELGGAVLNVAILVGQVTSAVRGFYCINFVGGQVGIGLLEQGGACEFDR